MKKSNCCQIRKIHVDSVEKVNDESLNPKTYKEVSDFFKILSDETRIKIIWALDQTEMCVCDLSESLNMTISAVSHQLALLRKFNIVKNRKSGKEVFYSLLDNHIKNLIDSTIIHIQEDK